MLRMLLVATDDVGWSALLFIGGLCFMVMIKLSSSSPLNSSSVAPYLGGPPEEDLGIHKIQ